VNGNGLRVRPRNRLCRLFKGFRGGLKAIFSDWSWFIPVSFEFRRKSPQVLYLFLSFSFFFDLC